MVAWSFAVLPAAYIFMWVLISPELNDSIKPVHLVHGGGLGLVFINISETSFKIITREDPILLTWV